MSLWQFLLKRRVESGVNFSILLTATATATAHSTIDCLCLCTIVFVWSPSVRDPSQHFISISLYLSFFSLWVGWMRDSPLLLSFIPHTIHTDNATILQKFPKCKCHTHQNKIKIPEFHYSHSYSHVKMYEKFHLRRGPYFNNNRSFFNLLELWSRLVVDQPLLPTQ